MGWPLSSIITNGLQGLASQFNNLRSDALRPLHSKLNNSGSVLDEGSVVVYDFSAANAFKTTTIQGDPSICGIVISSSIAAGASGYLARDGNQLVKVTGVVTAGNRLIASSTPGYAMDSGRTQRGATGDIGIATTGHAGSGTGTVYADLDIHPFASSNILQKLPTVTPYANAASQTVHTFSHEASRGYSSDIPP